jgi:signal transduction histidine kinase/phage shock protein PspC (stress-responsive transcriptional regulator)
MTRPQPPQPRGRLYRDQEQRVLVGVAAGIAKHVGLPVLAVRIAFCVLLGFNGIGAVLYAVFWAVLPADPDRPARGRDWQAALPFIAIGGGVLLVQQLVGVGGVQSAIGWLVALVALGAGVIWHQADPQRRARLEKAVSNQSWLTGVVGDGDRPRYLLRLIGGGLLVTIGVVGITAVIAPIPGPGITSLLNSLVFSLVALTGVGLVVAPVLWRMFGQLRTEREARIRETERAELAAMVHDQVLHTLALIQRNASDSKSVLRLARGQERTLRNWLYKPSWSPSERFAAALEAIAGEIEDTYPIAVEVVVVGDRPVDEPVGALIRATREATVNAARHAGVDTISLYAEVEPDEISVFVRDRGKGFDLDTVEESRHGVRGSIIGRMARHGGKAEIRSEQGEGTEVRLVLPVSAVKEAAAEGAKTT